MSKRLTAKDWVTIESALEAYSSEQFPLTELRKKVSELSVKRAVSELRKKRKQRRVNEQAHAGDM